MRAVIADVFARHMEGESPENIELMFRRAYSSGFTQRPDLTVMGAFSGLEIACWDILGKARGRPVWALLGGRMNDRVRAYTYLYPAAASRDARFWVSTRHGRRIRRGDCVARGYTAVKFDPAGPYTIRGGHMPAMARHRALRRLLPRRSARRWATAPTCFSAPTASSPRRGDPAGQALEPFSPRSGSRNRSRRTTCWTSPRSRAPCGSPSPPASG
jgi:galactonate dehydratase